LSFARQRALPADLIGKDVPGELLGDRRKAAEAVQHGTGEPYEIDAVMRVESLVFGGDERLPQRQGISASRTMVRRSIPNR